MIGIVAVLCVVEFDELGETVICQENSRVCKVCFEGELFFLVFYLIVQSFSEGFEGEKNKPYQIYYNYFLNSKHLINFSLYIFCTCTFQRI